MKQKEVDIDVFDANCLQLVDIVKQKRTKLVITKHDKLIAKLVPIATKQMFLFGCMKDSVIIRSDIVSSTDTK